MPPSAGPPFQVRVGAVLSSLMVREAAFVLSPASLEQEPLKIAPAVSVVWNWSAMQLTGLLMLSVPLVLTVTSLTYQPLMPSVPAVTASVALGPVLSSLTVSGAALVLRPASLVQEPLKIAPVASVVWN